MPRTSYLTRTATSAAAGVRAFWTAWTDNLRGLPCGNEELIDAGVDVVVVARIRGQGIATGVEVCSNSFAQLARLRRENPLMGDIRHCAGGPRSVGLQE